MQNYLELARQGKNGAWRSVLAVLLMLFAWQVLGAMPSAILVVWMALHGQLQAGSLGSSCPEWIHWRVSLRSCWLPYFFWVEFIFPCDLSTAVPCGHW